MTDSVEKKSKSNYSETFINRKLWEDFHNHLILAGTNIKRITKLMMVWHVLERGLPMTWDKVTKEHIQNFVLNLRKDEFKKQNGKPYSANTKLDILKFLKQFWKWYKGIDYGYPPEVSWIKAVLRQHEELPPEEILAYPKDIMKMSNAFDKIEYKILVLLLFDSGFRIMEMQSVEKKDLKWDEKTKSYWIYCNETKAGSFKRRIPIPLFTSDINTFVSSAYFQSLKDTDKIFPMQYNAIAKAIREAGQRTFKRRIHAHLFRHSSASWWITKINNWNEFTKRFGWTPNSADAQGYLHKLGNIHESQIEIANQDTTMKIKEDLSNQLQQQREENEILKKNMEIMSRSLQALYSSEIESALYPFYPTPTNDEEDKEIGAVIEGVTKKHLKKYFEICKTKEISITKYCREYITKDIDEPREKALQQMTKKDTMGSVRRERHGKRK